jgi:carbonic anhydrase/acetyltransferase-like protein (isoleucine patch superfamily)
MLYHLGERCASINPTAFIAPNATVIGSVILEADASLWFNVVVRADNDLIRIGAGSNVQDGAVLHVDPGFPITIGRDVTIGHQAIVHGCTIGAGSLVGMHAVILNGATIGAGCLIGAHALVIEGMEIPDGSLVLGAPARVVRTLDASAQARLKESAVRYVENARRYRAQLRPAVEEP